MTAQTPARWLTDNRVKSASLSTDCFVSKKRLVEHEDYLKYMKCDSSVQVISNTDGMCHKFDS